MQNLSVIELENEVLRSRYADLKRAAEEEVKAVESYVKQGILRSDLLNTTNHLKSLLK